MKRAVLSALASLALACPAFAHADTVETLVFNATLTNGTAYGTVTFDETTGLFTGGGIQATYNGKIYNFNTFEGSSTYDTITGLLQDSNSGLTFQLTIPGTSNQNYTGGQVCSSSYNAGCQVTGGPAGDYYYTGFSTANGHTDWASAGSLAQTPEPSSFVLLGTGLLGVFGAARRRFLSA